ncbi:DNA-binding protein [Methylobacterium sp. CM6247]
MKQDTARPTGANATGLSDDPVIVGAENIAIVIYGENEGQREGNIRRIYHAISKKELPTFKLGGRVHARRSTILAWIESQERAA